MLAAALGVRRDDDEGLQELKTLRFGVRVDQEGGLLVDFHTANNPTPQQTAKARAAGKAPPSPYVTRRDVYKRQIVRGMSILSFN